MAGISELIVRELTDNECARWDAFVKICPEASFFHRAGWKRVIEDAFGHPTCFLFAERNGQIEGVLPLAQINSFLFGNTLISLPFCVYGGVAASSAEASTLLLESAVKRAEALSVDALELRNQKQQNPAWLSKDLYVTFRKEIDPDPEKNLTNIPRKQRAMVRKGIKGGLQGDWDDGIDRFYDTYSQSVHALGTPVFPRRYFSILHEEFSGNIRVLTVSKNGRTVASVMSFYFRDEVLPYYGGGTPEARLLKGNDFMYWDLMRRSAEEGIRIFDFGRSKQGTGSFSFKKNWGFDAQQLRYEFKLVKAKEMPDISPMNAKYRTFIKMWKMLPLPIANTIGPWIARSLG